MMFRDQLARFISLFNKLNNFQTYTVLHTRAYTYLYIYVKRNIRLDMEMVHKMCVLKTTRVCEHFANSHSKVRQNKRMNKKRCVYLQAKANTNQIMYMTYIKQMFASKLAFNHIAISLLSGYLTLKN